jgi:hypothetical protein
VVHAIAGFVNGYEMLLIIAVHPLRDAQEIDEIRASLFHLTRVLAGRTVSASMPTADGPLRPGPTAA